MDGYNPMQILLVEDNLDDVELTRRALMESRVTNELSVARDGQEALDFLFRQGEHGNAADTPRPDLILLSLSLTGVNGVEILEQIRANEQLSTIPVIMLTSSEREEDIAKSYKLGSNTHISKPVEFAKFIHAVEMIGGFWIAFAELAKAA